MIQWPFYCLSKIIALSENLWNDHSIKPLHLNFHRLPFVCQRFKSWNAGFFFSFFFAFWAKLIDHHKMRLACEIFLKQSKLTGPPNLHSFPEVKRISVKRIDSIPSRTLFNKNYIWKSRGKLCTLKKLKELWPYWLLRNR